MSWFHFQCGVSFLFYLTLEKLCACWISWSKFYVWSWSEVPFNNWLHRKKFYFFFFFLSHLTEDQMQKLITELIFHQIPLLPGHWGNIHLMPNYVWALGGLMWCRVADWQVWDNCVCVKHTAGTACLPDRLQPWESYLDAHFNSSNSSPCCQRKQGVGLILCNTFPPLHLHTTSHFSLQHQNLRASYGMVDRSLLLRWELAWRGVNERGGFFLLVCVETCSSGAEGCSRAPACPHTAWVARASQPASGHFAPSAWLSLSSSV